MASHLVDAAYVFGASQTSTGLQVGADSLPRPVVELGELAVAGLEDGRDLVLRLLRDGNGTVEVLVDKQTDEELRRTKGEEKQKRFSLRRNRNQSIPPLRQLL